MPEIVQRTMHPRKSARFFHEVAFSIYFPLLLITANTMASAQHPETNSWADKLYTLTIGDKQSQPDGHAHRFAFFLLWGAAALVLFLCVRTLSGLSFTDFLLRTFAGVVAVAGFPLVSGYLTFRGYLHMLGSFPRALLYAYAPHNWLAVEVTASLVCVFIYAFGKWNRRTRWGLLLLALHFGVWTWLIRDLPIAICPLLGFPASVAWALYARQGAHPSWPPEGATAH